MGATDKQTDRAWWLREGTQADAPLIAALIREAFAEYTSVLDPPTSAVDETADTIRRKLERATAVVAYAGDVPTGCVLYEARTDHLYFFRLAVLPAYRRHGLGRALIEHVEAIARNRGYTQIRLGVRVTLTKQRAYYERLGYHFLETGTHPGLTEPTYLILAKELGTARGSA